VRRRLNLAKDRSVDDLCRCGIKDGGELTADGAAAHREHLASNLTVIRRRQPPIRVQVQTALLRLVVQLVVQHVVQQIHNKSK